MKDTDLMAGDYVEVDHAFVVSGTPYYGKVMGIVKKKNACFVQFGEDFMVDIDRCHPIPITPTILDNNGFTMEHSRAEGNIWKWDEGDLLVTWCEEDGYTTISSHTSEHASFYGWIQNVHNLQQILRFLGIDKDIEIEHKQREKENDEKGKPTDSYYHRRAIEKMIQDIDASKINWKEWIKHAEEQNFTGCTPHSPRFKEGEWITNPSAPIYKVLAVNTDTYTLLDTPWKHVEKPISEIDEQYRRLLEPYLKNK